MGWGGVVCVCVSFFFMCLVSLNNFQASSGRNMTFLRISKYIASFPHRFQVRLDVPIVVALQIFLNTALM